MKSLSGLTLLVLLALTCVAEPAAPSAQLEAEVLRTADTIRFRAKAAAYRCQASRGTLFEGISFASGVLVWLRGANDSATGAYPVRGMRDTVTRRGATVAVRFAAQSVPHTVSLDSGTVLVTDSAGSRWVDITGSGLDLNGGTRPRLRATFRAMPSLLTDSAACTQ